MAQFRPRGIFVTVFKNDLVGIGVVHYDALLKVEWIPRKFKQEILFQKKGWGETLNPKAH